MTAANQEKTSIGDDERPDPDDWPRRNVVIGLARSMHVDPNAGGHARIDSVAVVLERDQNRHLTDCLRLNLRRAGRASRRRAKPPGLMLAMKLGDLSVEGAIDRWDVDVDPLARMNHFERALVDRRRDPECVEVDDGCHRLAGRDRLARDRRRDGSPCRRRERALLVGTVAPVRRCYWR